MTNPMNKPRHPVKNLAIMTVLLIMAGCKTPPTQSSSSSSSSPTSSSPSSSSASTSSSSPPSSSQSSAPGNQSSSPGTTASSPASQSPGVSGGQPTAQGSDASQQGGNTQQTAGQPGQMPTGTGTANMPGQGDPGGSMSDDQVLSEAMEVFNRSVQSGGTPGDPTQGQNGNGGPLDRTAAGNTGDGESGMIPGGNNGSGMQTAGQGDMPGSPGTGETSTGMDGTSGQGNPGMTTGSPSPNGTGQAPVLTGASGQASGGYGDSPGTAGALPGGSMGGQGGEDYDFGNRRVIVVGDGRGVMTGEEQVEDYDRELEEQMRVFDGIILGRRQEAIARSNEDGADVESGQGGAAYTGDSGFESAPLLTTVSRSEDPNNVQTRGRMPDAPGDDREGAYRNQNGPNDNIPDDISDGSDDDIVARQLREAAIAEKDPELREKLWDEYRKYKEGVQARR